MATLAIGDVHGQFKSLKKLLKIAKVNPQTDQVIFVGDLIGRGKQSVEVLQMVMQMQDHAKVILGNHDLHFIYQYYKDKDDDEKVARLVNHEKAVDFANFLRCQEFAIGMEEIKTVVLHAGNFFAWDYKQTLQLAQEVKAAFSAENYQENIINMYGDNGNLWQDKLSGGLRLQTLVNIFTRMRCVNVDGGISWLYRGQPAEDIPPGTCPWFDYPLRKMKDYFIVCGHWSSLGLFMRNDIAMIDTGCCFGGPLTGLWLEDKQLVFAN